MKRDDKGVVKTISRAEGEHGKTVIRVVVDFYDGAEPNINNGTVWHARPVTVSDATIDQS